MKISIASRNRPFSHAPGASCLLPGSCWTIQAFPTLIILRNREHEGALDRIEIPLKLTGPIHEFTLQQDLEKGIVWVWGMAQEGRFRISLQAILGKVELRLHRAPKDGLICGNQTLHSEETIAWPISNYPFEKVNLERLSFGNHRMQEWEKLWQPLDLFAVIPILFHLGQWTPRVSKSSSSKMFSLMDRGWKPFLMAAFSGILNPRLTDDQFQGIIPFEKIDPKESPIPLITEAALRIRKVFVLQEGFEISLLSNCDFESGRMVNVHLENIGILDFEWRKRSLRSMCIHAMQDAKIQFKFSKAIESFRIRTSMQGKGDWVCSNDRLNVIAGKEYFLDRFQK